MNHSDSRKALILATLAFAANFSVWTLYAVMGVEIRSSLNLSATEYGVLLASPIITGALFRLPVGMLCEYYSPKRILTYQMLMLVPAIWALKFVDTYQGYLVVGALIGISGVSFTSGISYVSRWYKTKEQGFAMGVFGAGNFGAAITLAIVPLIIKFWGWEHIATVYALGMSAMTLIFAWFSPNESLYDSSRQRHQFKIQIDKFKDVKVWQFGLYYYFVFGSFLALILWLPEYYMRVYKQSFESAMAFTLFFVATSSMVRALGGWFSDRYGGKTVNWGVFWICLVCLFFLSYPPTTMIIHGTEKDVNLFIEVNLWVFTGLIFIIGVAQGFGRASVYKTIYDYYPESIGSVGGMVAMIGAMGGCTLPVFFGVAVDLFGIHTACFMLLYGLLAFCMMVMYVAGVKEKRQRLLREAIARNFLNS